MKLKAEAQTSKYGLVRVYNPDGTHNRDYKITGQEYKDLAKKGANAPPNLTKKEWESGLAVAYGKDFDIGDIQEQSDGSLIIKMAEEVKQGRIVESFAYLTPDDWTGIAPNITITQKALDHIDDPTKKMKKYTDKRPISIINGELTI